MNQKSTPTFLKYTQAIKDPEAVNKAYDFLFEKVLELRKKHEGKAHK